MNPRGSMGWPSALPLRYESLRWLKLFTAKDVIDDSHRPDRLTDIMGPHDPRPLHHREGRRRDAPRQPFARLTASQSLDEGISRHADNDRVAEGHDLVQAT